MPRTREEKAAYAKEWRSRNPNYMREWSAKHPGYRSEWNRANPERAHLNVLRYRARHADALSEYSKAYEQRPARKKSRRERMRKWRIQNPELSRARNRDWHHANPDKILELNRAYRARSWRAHGDSTPEQIAARVEYYGNCCSYCGGEFECIDHVIPLSRGGTHWPSNIRPACLACNSSKRDRTLVEFIAYRDEFREAA